MDTLGKILLVGGLVVAGFVVYKMFIDPNRMHNLGESMREYEKHDPAVVKNLKGLGIDLHKLEDKLDPHAQKEAKAHYAAGDTGRYISYF